MTNRDRDSLKAFLAEEAERERLALEERDRPIKEATAQLIENHRKLAQVERERLTGTIADPDRYFDPSVGPALRMTEKQAAEFNVAEFEKYRQARPDVYWSPELLSMVSAYLTKEKLRIVTAGMLDRLIARFAEVGLLPEKPIEPEPEPLHEEPVYVAPVEPETFEGHDPDTGEPRSYTAYQVERMDSQTYQRTFRIPRLAPPSAPHAAF